MSIFVGQEDSNTIDINGYNSGSDNSDSENSYNSSEVRTSSFNFILSPKRTAIKGRYVGDYKNGLRHGKGVLIDLEGNSYDAEFKYGNLYGKANILYTNGNKYEGNMRYNLLHGYGKMTYEDGGKYQGDYMNGSKSGYGVYKNKYGDVYDGEFEIDNFHGHGILTLKNDILIKRKEGIWFDNYQHGQGKIIYKDNTIYKGSFKFGLKDGPGVEFSNNQTIKYNGSFRNDKYHGNGRLYGEDGRPIYNGKFKKGLYNGYGEQFENDILIFYGNFTNGLKNGVGHKINSLGHYEEKVYIDGIEWEDLESKFKEDCDKNCVICMSKIEEESNIILLDCKHSYHSKCLQTWFLRNETCPLCRVDIKHTCRKRKLEE